MHNEEIWQRKCNIEYNKGKTKRGKQRVTYVTDICKGMTENLLGEIEKCLKLQRIGNCGEPMD